VIALDQRDLERHRAYFQHRRNPVAFNFEKIEPSLLKPRSPLANMMSSSIAGQGLSRANAAYRPPSLHWQGNFMNDQRKIAHQGQADVACCWKALALCARRRFKLDQSAILRAGLKYFFGCCSLAVNVNS